MIRLWKEWRHRRREESADSEALMLREFVYLDEVSVTSLLSSRLGAIPSEFTDTLSDSAKAELNSNTEANAAVIKSRLGSRFELSRTQNRQVLRKATIQATFKDLYEGERESLALRPISSGEVPPDLDKIQKAIIASDTNSLDPWIVRPEQLKRGRLVEVEVELQADPVFRVSAIISTLAGIIEESDELTSRAGQEEMNKAVELNHVLEKLMAGLVPLRCRVVDHEVITIGGEEHVIHRRVIEQFPSTLRPSTKALYLVGVAEQELFWKDIRRVLFSRARVRVLCRLNHVGVRSSWTPVKLVDVLDEAVPGLAHQMDLFGSGALKAIMQEAESQERFIEPRLCALVEYGGLLAQHLGLELDSSDRAKVKMLASENADFLISVSEGRKAFRVIADFLADRFSRGIDPTVSSQLRVRACQRYGLLLGGSDAKAKIVSDVDNLDDTEEEQFIDAEIIAIYW